MTLAEFPPPWVYQDCVGKALVFGEPIRHRLSQLHSAHGTTNLVPVPAPLPDGRFFLCADLLTEVGPGGLLSAMWSEADKAILMTAVEVIPFADAMALLPQPELP